MSGPATVGHHDEDDVLRHGARPPRTDVLPWYRQAWPWFLIALPATAVIAGIVTAVLAMRGYDGPVTADYYKQGLAINEEVSRAELARGLGLQARLALDGFSDGDRVRVELTAERGTMPPEPALRLRLVHPGRRVEDRVAVLSRTEAAPDGRRAVFTGTFQPPADGARTAEAGTVHWQVVLESREWRIDDALTPDGGGNYVLKAGAAPGRPKQAAPQGGARRLD